MVIPSNYEDLALPLIRVKSCVDFERGDICSPKDFELLDETKYNSIVLLGDCNSGKSALCHWLGYEMEARNRKVHVIDLPRAALLWKIMKKPPNSLFELINVYFGNGAVSFKEKSELLLDEHHQLSSNDHRRLRSILTKVELAGENFPIRVWVFARKNFENRICTEGERQAVFELAGYSVSDQQQIIFDQLENDFGKAKEEHEKEARKDYVRCLYGELKRSFPDFEKSLGKCPVMLDAIAVSVLPHFKGFVKGYNEQKKDVKKKTTNEIVEGLPLVPKGSMVSHIISALGMTHVHKKRGLKKKDITHAMNLLMLVISEYGLDTFPSYDEGELKIDMRKRDMICDSGFVFCDDQGKLKFHDKILADALIGRYFADPVIAHYNPKTIDFFTKNLLLKKEAALIRYFYNMALYDDKSKNTIFHPKMTRNFIINMYKLNNHEEWLKIRDKGNIWHMYILERNYQLAGFLLECFDPIRHKKELMRFLKMRAPLSITCLLKEDNIGNKPFQVLVSKISFAAMFFSARDTELMLKLMLYFWTEAEIKAEFTTEKSWTPIHFAAMNANFEFIRTMYIMKDTIPTTKNLRNPFDQTAVHLVHYSLAWKYELELGDNMGANRSHWAEILAGKKIDEYMHECLQLLVKKGGEDVNACEGTTGNTLLHMALKAKRLPTIDFLLELGANPRICDVTKRNPVYYAAKFGNLPYMIRLFSRCHAASLFAKDAGGTCALSIWRDEGQHKYIKQNGPLSISQNSFFHLCYQFLQMLNSSK